MYSAMQFIECAAQSFIEFVSYFINSINSQNMPK